MWGRIQPLSQLATRSTTQRDSPLPVDHGAMATFGALLGVVLGGLIAAGAGWWQSKRQRTWQREDFALGLQATRDQEVRERADAKADEVLAELQEMETLLLRRPFGRYIWPDDREERAVVTLSLARLSQAALSPAAVASACRGRCSGTRRG